MKTRRIIIAIAMVALILPAVAYAQGPGGPGGKGGGKGELGMPRGAWWQQSNVVKQLKLSGSQQKKIESLTLAHRKDMIRLRAELQLKEVDLDPLLSAGKLDEKKIKGLMGEIEVVRTKISKSRMDMLFEIRKVLSREQYLKLKQFKGLKSRRVKRGGVGGARRPRGQTGPEGPARGT